MVNACKIFQKENEGEIILRIFHPHPLFIY